MCHYLPCCYRCPNPTPHTHPLSHTHTHTHARTRTRALSLSHTHPISLTHTLSLSFFLLVCVRVCHPDACHAPTHVSRTAAECSSAAIIADVLREGDRPATHHKCRRDLKKIYYSGFEACLHSAPGAPEGVGCKTDLRSMFAAILTNGGDVIICVVYLPAPGMVTEGHGN